MWGHGDNRSEGVMNHKNKVLSGGDDGLVTIESNDGRGCCLGKRTVNMYDA